MLKRILLTLAESHVENEALPSQLVLEFRGRGLSRVRPGSDFWWLNGGRLPVFGRGEDDQKPKETEPKSKKSLNALAYRFVPYECVKPNWEEDDQRNDQHGDAVVPWNRN